MPLPPFEQEVGDDVRFQYQTIKGVKHYVFRNKDDFYEFHGGKDNAPALVEDWHEAEEGDWVIADDGGIVQMLKVSRYLPHPGDSHGKAKYRYHKGWCRTVVGTFFINKNREKFKMDTDFSKHESRYTFSGTSGNLHLSRMNSRDGLTKKERQFCFSIVYLMSSGKPINVYEIYSMIFKRVRPENVMKRCNHLLKQDRIMNELMKGVEEAAEKLKITHETVLRRLDDLSTGANNEDVKFKATVKLGDAIGTFNKGNKQLPGRDISGYFSGFSSSVVEEIEEETKMVSGASINQQHLPAAENPIPDSVKEFVENGG